MMKKLKLTKVIASSLIIASILAINPIGTSALGLNQINTSSTPEQVYADSSQWTFTGKGWVCISKSNQMYGNAWICTNGKWYYIDDTGNMVKNTWVNDYFVGSDGAWDASSVTNTSANATTTNTTLTIKTYTNTTVAKYQAFDGTNGFKEVEDNKYIYYENGQILKKCWKEFDDGFRYFDNYGYLVCDGELGGTIKVGSDGAIVINNKKIDKEETRKRVSVDIAKILVLDKSFSLDEIEYIAKVFNIKVNTEYEDVYEKSSDGKILNITGTQYNEDSYEICDSITIHIGKYASRLNLN